MLWIFWLIKGYFVVTLIQIQSGKYIICNVYVVIFVGIMFCGT